MVKWALLLVAVVIGLRFGVIYLLSDEFQEYADTNDVQWTCHMNKSVGELYSMLSSYDKAYRLFKYIPKRCPGTAVAEATDFRMVYCIRSMGQYRNAVVQLKYFLEKYPKSSRRGRAIKLLRILKESL